MSSTQIQGQHIVKFLFAGKAKVTLKSKKTGKHFTYEVKAKEDSKDPEKTIYFVRYLNGPDNQADYAYLGMVPEPGKLIHTKASKAGKTAPVSQAFLYAMRNPTSSNLEVHHSNCCGRCGRELTDPISIETGIGPICREKMGA